MASLWNDAFALVLASGSVTRRRLLEAAGLLFEVLPAQVDERAIERGLPDASPATLARALAVAKAEAVSAAAPDALVIGADQVLSLQGATIHKSANRGEALAALLRLSGRSHRLTSAFAVAQGGRAVVVDDDAAQMTMRALDEAALSRYLDAAGPDVLGSVGVYQWEGLGAHLFQRVEGDHSTILGLPMLKLLAALRGFGALTI